ncbi:hypothetical protein FA13DRAFT_1734473 [Coprinellus micaceus]|uniref:Uncharacterized protein n=1 Tax=Coprinellus micaceus TaxID=71717 RepID=A0A4Y7T6C6_COPMI|nr:hypothetical protein FA13DRAFT_1734473 [Coprinellus micaceus]
MPPRARFRALGAPSTPTEASKTIWIRSTSAALNHPTSDAIRSGQWTERSHLSEEHQELSLPTSLAVSLLR